MKPGDRVRYSWVAMQKDWDYFHSCGRYDAKSRARDYYEKKLSERGTVTYVGPNKAGFYCIEIDWDNGVKSQTSDYLVQLESGPDVPHLPQIR